MVEYLLLHKIADIEESSCLFALGYRPNPRLDSAVFNFQCCISAFESNISSLLWLAG